MDFKSFLNSSGSYVDTTDYITSLVSDSSRWNVMADERACGKSMLLSMLYYFFERTENSGDLFRNKVVSCNLKDWDKYLNKYDVIILDFSDFEEKNLRSAKRYIYEKMRRIYFGKAKYLFENISYYVCSDDNYIRMLTGFWTDRVLEWSLKELLYACRAAAKKGVILSQIITVQIEILCRFFLLIT